MGFVIFDMDGVIFDSERAVYGIWKELSEKYGFAEIDKVYIRTIGVTRDVTRKIICDHYGPDFPYEKYQEESSRMFQSRYDGGRLPLKPGIKDLLVYLKGKEYKIAIASSTRAVRVRKQVEEAGLIEYFDVIVGGDMVSRSKPEPDIFLTTSELLGAKPSSTYVIEDSYNGIRAAYAGGFIPVMVPDMIPADDEMKQKAAYIFDRLKDIKSIIR